MDVKTRHGSHLKCRVTPHLLSPSHGEVNAPILMTSSSSTNVTPTGVHHKKTSQTLDFWIWPFYGRLEKWSLQSLIRFGLFVKGFFTLVNTPLNMDLALLVLICFCSLEI